MNQCLETIYLIHHSHTDIGFTHEQPVAMDLHARFIDLALDYCEQTADYPAGSALKWTCETIAPFLYWLRHRSDKQIERFLKLEKQGRVEVAAMFLVMSQCSSHESLYRQLYPVARLRKEYGLTITSAMQSDINGLNWGMVETLLDCGVSELTMAINENVGRAAFQKQRPNGFYWRGPSGRKLLVWNGLHYNSNNYFGFPGDWERTQRGLPPNFEDAVAKLPAYLDWLSSRGNPYPFSLFQVTHTTYCDNGPPDLRLAEFVRWWNQRGLTPRMQIVTLSEFMAVLRRQPADRLPVHRGEWTDFWNFGAASTAYETSLNRRTYDRLYESELALAMSDPATARRPELRESWENAWFYDEHTWGSNTSVTQPFRQSARSQLNHKLNFAYRARSLAQLTRLEALDHFARSVHADTPGYYVLALNTLPWEREERLEFPAAWLSTNAAATPSHVQALDRFEGSEQQGLGDQEMVVSIPVRIPPMGYRLLKVSDLKTQVVSPLGDKVKNAEAENPWLRVVLDPVRGGIQHLFDKERQRDWVDTQSDYPLAGYVHETCRTAKPTEPYGGRMHIFQESDWSKFMGYGGWHADWPAERHGITAVLEQHVHKLPGSTRLRQKCSAPGAQSVEYEVVLWDDKPYVDVRVTIDKLWSTAPEACYVAFPFALTGAQPRYQTAGGIVRPHEDQLPQCCQDYHTAQQWVDLSDSARGVTITTIDAPIVMFGGFNIAQLFDGARGPVPSLFLSLAMTNYYHVNYAGGQLGAVTFHYRIAPHDAFDITLANRLGKEAASPVICHPVLNPTGQRLPEKSFLTIGDARVTLLAMKPSEDGEAIVVRLFNSSESTCRTVLDFPSHHLESAWICDNLENPVSSVACEDGLHVCIAAWTTVAYRIKLAESGIKKLT